MRSNIGYQPSLYEVQMPKRTEMRWPVWCLIALLTLPALLWTYNELREMYWDSQYIKLGKAVDCRNRPSPAYLRCVPSVDGPECVHASTTPLSEWHAPIDYACAQFEPDRVFRFPVNKEPETLEVAAVSG